MYLGVLMSRIWFSPILASTPEKGIRLARENQFSLILFDGDVTVTELHSAMRLIKTEDSLKDLPLVVFIAADNPAKYDALLIKSCSAVLTKPLDLSIVHQVLSRLSGLPRTTQRVAVKMSVYLEIVKKKPGKVLASVNLSESGIYLRTLEPLPEKTLLHIKFTLPHDTEVIELYAEVVRTLSLGVQPDSEPGMALRFVDVPKGALLKIRNFVQWEVTGDLEWNSNI